MGSSMLKIDRQKSGIIFFSLRPPRPTTWTSGRGAGRRGERSRVSATADGAARPAGLTSVVAQRRFDTV